MPRRAVAYIRRSSGQDSPLSREAQESAIAAAATARGEVVRETFTDWGLSGSDRSRPAFLRMVAEMDAGRVSTVYAYDADRLARRTSTLALLLEAAAEVGTAVVDRHGRDLAGRDRMTGEVMAALDSEMLRKMTERNRANVAVRRARGDAMGRVPLGCRRVLVDGRYINEVVDAGAIARVVDLYRETGTLNGTAKRLNAALVPSATGKRWYAPTVAKIIDREAPDLRRFRRGQGVRADTVPRALSRLLICPHDGMVLTPGLMRNGGTRWYCRACPVDVTHPRPYGISEFKLMPWVTQEAARLRVPGAVETVVAEGEDQQVGLQAKRDRIIDAAMDGIITKVERDRRLADVDAALARVATRIEVVAVPPAIDWTWEPGDINAVLRAMWERVELDERLMPVRAEWRVPEWRA